MTVTHPLHDVDPGRIDAVVAGQLDAGITAWHTLAEQVSAPAMREAVAAAGHLVVETLRRGNTILVAGNGGSSAIATHVAAEFTGKCIADRAPLPAICLADSVASLTAVGNDYGFDQVFVRGVRGLGRPGDLLIAMSTSGRSANITAAVHAARERGIATIALTGGTGGDLVDLADHCLVVPSTETPRIQEVHMLWAHAWCEAVDLLSQ